MPIPGECLVARRLAAVSFLLLAAVAGAPPAHAAPPTELFFSEYVEGSSNNKALEIYNGTGDAIDLADRRLQRAGVLQRQRQRRLTST